MSNSEFTLVGKTNTTGHGQDANLVLKKIQQYGIYNYVPEQFKQMFEEGNTKRNSEARKFIEREYLREIKENVLDNASLGIYARFENGTVVYEGGKKMENLSEGLEITISHGSKFFVHFFCKHVEAARILRGEDPFTGVQAIVPYKNFEEGMIDRERDEESYFQRTSQCIEIPEWDNVEETAFTVPQMAQIAAPIEEETIDHDGNSLNMNSVTFFLYKSSSYLIGNASDNVKIENGYCVINTVGKFLIGGLVCPHGPEKGRITVNQHNHAQFSTDSLVEMVSKYSPTPVKKVSTFEKESIHGSTVSNVVFVNMTFENLPESLSVYRGSAFFVSRMMRSNNISIGGEAVYLSCKITKDAPMKKRGGKKTFSPRQSPKVYPSAGSSSSSSGVKMPPRAPYQEDKPRAPVKSVWNKPLQTQ